MIINKLKDWWNSLNVSEQVVIRISVASLVISMYAVVVMNVKGMI